MMMRNNLNQDYIHLRKAFIMEAVKFNEEVSVNEEGQGINFRLL